MLNKYKRLLIVIIFVLLLISCSSKKEDPQNSEKKIKISKTEQISRVTGESLPDEKIPNPNDTHIHYGISATDLGIMWDATTNKDPKIMLAFGDSYDDGWNGFGGGGTGWRSNFLAFSNDKKLSDGLNLSSVIVTEQDDTYAKEIIPSDHNTSGLGDFTTIPTAGVSVANRHFIHYMQIRKWGNPGKWSTNFSEIAYSDDEGENWTLSDLKWDSDSNFAQASFVKDEGYVYMYGTESGRFGGVYISRVPELELLDKTKYEYWNGSGWKQDTEESAVEIVQAPVSELSVQYNSFYDRWIMMYLNEDKYALVIRTSKNLEKGWSEESVVVSGDEYPQLYGGFIHPWGNESNEIYYTMSMWGPYNVFLMKSSLEFE